MKSTEKSRTPLYVGTYTRVLPYDTGHGKNGDGIYLYYLNMSSGSLEFTRVTDGIVNPSFLVLNPSQNHLYAASEMTGPKGIEAPGYVSAFYINPATLDLTFLNRKLSGGIWPCHMTTDESGDFLLLVNYEEACTAVFPIMKDGSLGESMDSANPAYHGNDRNSQQISHLHSVTFDDAEQIAFSVDKGKDQILIYHLDKSSGKLNPLEKSSVSVKPGSGPRHFDFHPNRKYAYVINELDSTIITFSYNATSKTLQKIQTISTLPDGFSGNNTGSDIHVHPSGKFLYGSNRGHDSIAIYKINKLSGTLEYIDNEPTGGQTPRNFGVDPTGTFLLAANQDSDTVVSFRIDQESGELNPTGNVADIPSPACVRFVKRKHQ